VNLRRVGILLAKEFLYGSRSYIFIFSIVGPIVISVVISLALGTWLPDTPKLGIVDEGNSQFIVMIQKLDSIESREYYSVFDIKQAVEDGKVDMGIIVPSGFDDYVIEGEPTEIKAYIWGESLAKSRTIIGVTIADTIRELAGQESPVEINTTTLGEGASIPWSDRLLPLIVLVAIFLGGLMLPATSLATEKEKRTLPALAVTPVSLGDIFLSKGLLGFILSVFMGIFILILNQAFGSEPLLLTLILAFGAIMAAELGMLLGAFVKDFAMLFTIWKTAGIILFAPVFVFLFPQIPEWVGKIFPTYYILQPIVELSQLGGGWSDIATNTYILIGIDVTIIIILLAVIRKRQYAIISS
jgi:ABC-2 type transport system permease protein